MNILRRPDPTEYEPHFAGYISLVPELNVLTVLEGQGGAVRAVLPGMTAERERFRYAPEKWSVREVLGHLADCERVFGYRALAIGRGEKQPLPGFDEDAYMLNAGFDERPAAEIVAEFAAVRDANLTMLRAFDDEAWGRLGTSNGATISVRALAWIMAGHVRHHLAVLSERYAMG